MLFACISPAKGSDRFSRSAVLRANSKVSNCFDEQERFAGSTRQWLGRRCCDARGKERYKGCHARSAATGWTTLWARASHLEQDMRADSTAQAGRASYGSRASGNRLIAESRSYPTGRRGKQLYRAAKASLGRLGAQFGGGCQKQCPGQVGLGWASTVV